MRGSPQQQAQMYANGVHYGYTSNPTGWNPNAHPSQQYNYPQNPSYDPSAVPTPSQQQQQQQQQYYPPQQMHNPAQGYDYGQPPQMNRE
jgi:hypothetical protein